MLEGGGTIGSSLPQPPIAQPRSARRHVLAVPRAMAEGSIIYDCFTPFESVVESDEVAPNLADTYALITFHII
jgi:hypothetical protein